MEDIFAMSNFLQMTGSLSYVCALGLAFLLCGVVENISGKIKAANRCRNREYALKEMEEMSDGHFKRMFRMSRHAFGVLLERLCDFSGDDATDELQACRSSGSLMSMRTKLACTLRWLAGGSYLDICFEFGVGPGSFYQEDGVLWSTMLLIDALLDISFPFDFPDELQDIAAGFANCSKHQMSECVLAIDGWVCRTRQPYVWEVDNPSAYRNRHGCFGIVVLAGCDAMCRFHMFSCVSAGSTNDILAWDLSTMKLLMEQGRLPLPYYFIGDEAFTNSAQLLTPWSGHGLDTWKDSFNYHLSSMRQCIERAFGLLTQRWGIFWRPLRCSFDKWTLVCTVAAKLHNFCIDMKEGGASDIPMRNNSDWQDGDHPSVFMNGNDDTADLERPTGDTRRRITEELYRNGVRRPLHAMVNSRM